MWGWVSFSKYSHIQCCILINFQLKTNMWQPTWGVSVCLFGNSGAPFYVGQGFSIWVLWNWPSRSSKPCIHLHKGGTNCYCFYDNWWLFFFFFPYRKSCLLYDGQQYVEEMCEAETGLLGRGSKHTQWFYCLPWSWPFVSAFCPSVCHASHIEVGIIASRLNEERPQQFVCNLTWTLGFWKAVFLFFFKHCCSTSCA